MFEYVALYGLAKEVIGYIKDTKSAVDAGKDIYKAGKAAAEHFKDKQPEPPKEVEPKLIDFDWLERSPFKKLATEAGYEVKLARPDRISTLELEGYEVMYEVDPAANTKRRLVLRDGLTLVGKKV